MTVANSLMLHPRDVEYNLYKQYDVDRAKRTFKWTRLKSRLWKLWTFITGRSSDMLDLRQVEATVSIRQRRYSGVRTVAIEDIRGSENRSKDFDGHFNPLHKHIEERWVGIATEVLQGTALPPVELIKVGETYFVRDGHHRVSAARALGQQAIDAVVTTWEVS